MCVAVQASPLLSLCIVGVQLAAQCAVGGVRVFFSLTNSGDPLAFSRVLAVPFVLAYFAATCYFLHAGTSVLRSLIDKRSRIMSAYMLASSIFMVMHLAALACIASEVLYLSELHVGLVFFFVYLSRAGTAMCCISIFHAHAGSAFLFMETENERLAEDVRRLEETATLSQQLRDAETARSEAEIARLEAERKAERAEVLSQKKLVQKERDMNATTQHEVGNPVSVITGTTEYLLDTLKAELTPGEARARREARPRVALSLHGTRAERAAPNGRLKLGCEHFCANIFTFHQPARWLAAHYSDRKSPSTQVTIVC